MLASLVLSTLGVPHTHVILEPATGLPSGWRVVGRSKPQATIELTFAVKQRHLVQLHDILQAVSSPHSTRYGQHLSTREVHDLVAPASEHIEQVLAFATGAVRASPNGDLLTATMTIQRAEALLDARYEELEHIGGGLRIHRCAHSGYRVPRALREALDFVAPTVHVPSVPPRALQVTKDATRKAVGDGDLNVPSTLRELYSIGNTVGGSDKSRMAVTAFLGQTFSQDAVSMLCHYECLRLFIALPLCT